MAETKSRCRHSAATLWTFCGHSKEKGLSIAAKPFYKLVEAAGLEPASRKPTSFLHAYFYWDFVFFQLLKCA
jgi:hypothetical protein